MKFSYSRRCLLMTTALAVTCFGAEAMAQSSNEGGTALEEVVVTATRQSQNLSKVPISVAAYSEEQMNKQGVRNVDDIVRLTPGVSIGRANTSPLGATVTIRGISAGGVGAGTTGIYIDDTPIQVRTIGFSSSSTFPVVFDLERVEILRGPQGTLFGAGSEGGAIRFITPKPNFSSFSGMARAELASIQGGDESYEAGVAVGGPIAEDRLAFRASAYYRRNGGYIDRVPQGQMMTAEKNANWNTATTGRLALAWRATEDLTITPSLAYQKLTSNGTGQFWEAQSDREEHQFISGNKFPEPFKDRFVVPSLNVEWDLGDIDFVSSTSLFSRKSFGVNDYTIVNAATHAGTAYLTPATNYFYSVSEQTNKQDNYHQEVRLQSSNPDARLNWVIGAFIEHNRQVSIQATISPPFPQFYEQVRGRSFLSAFGRGLLPGGVYLLSWVKAVDKQQAVFANVDFNVTEKLKLTVGARYAKTSFKYEAFYDGPSSGPAAFGDGGSQSEKPFTPKIGVSYQIDDYNMIYASASKGFRPGGAQARNPPLCQPELTSLGYDTPPTTFNSDSVWAYELGSKNRFADGRIRVEASVYQIDWKDIQRSVPLTSCARNFVANLGSARSRGFDLAAQALIGENLNVGVAVGYNDAELTEDVLGGSANGVRRILAARGDSLGQSPWNVSINAEYTFPILAHEGFVRGDFTYASKQARPTNRNPITASYDPALTDVKETSLLNLRAGIRLPTTDISLFVNNALDASPLLSRGHGARTSPLFTLTTFQPRTVGVTVAQKF